MAPEQEGPSLDRLANLIERAYVERYRRRAAALLARWGDDDAARKATSLAGVLSAGGAIRPEARRLALVLHAKAARPEDVLDLREVGSRPGPA